MLYVYSYKLTSLTWFTEDELFVNLGLFYSFLTMMIGEKMALPKSYLNMLNYSLLAHFDESNLLFWNNLV